MKVTLDIRIANAEGALERILGRLRQRAFSVCNIHADRTADHAFLDVSVTVESARPIELAAKQIGKLFDVANVQVSYAEAGAQHGYRQY